MKLDKLLKSNVFLINSSVCLVILLIICYFGVSFPIKETYSLTFYDTVSECESSCDGTCKVHENGFYCEETKKNSLIGMYRWKNEITDYNGVLVDFDFDVSFISGDVQFNKLTIDFSGVFSSHEIIYSATNAEVVLKASNSGLKVDSADPSSLSEKADLLKMVYFDKEFVIENNDVYDWFMENLIIDEKCYYNATTGKFIFSNIPTSGFIVTNDGLNNKAACEANTNTKFEVVYNVDGVTNSVYVDIGTAVTLPNASKEGYNFKGWYTSATDGVRKGGIGELFTPTEDITLYSQWEEAVIDIDFGDYTVDDTNMYIIFEVNTEKADAESNIKIPSKYSLVITTLNDNAKLNTGARVKILKPDDTIYAEYTAIILGDVSGDGYIGTADYISIYNSLAGDKTLSSIEEAAADFKNDGSVDSGDYIKMYNHFIGEE